MKCKNLCGKDLTGRQKNYCSDRCRKQAIRAAVVKVNSDKLGRSNSDKLEVGQKPDKQLSVDETLDIIESSDKIGREMREELTANDLYVAIRNYPQDTWKDSPEFKELMKRLHSMSIEELEAGGYDIPCWKYSEAA